MTLGGIRVAVASCVEPPERDVDEDLLLRAAQAQGVDAVVAGWDDAAVDWSAFDAVVIRSTWNYHVGGDAGRFLGWCRSLRGVTSLMNPESAVCWNADKSYLLELAGAGIPVVPTVRVSRGDAGSISEVARGLGWDRCVIKPIVSAGSRSTYLLDARELEEPPPDVVDRVSKEDMLLQPYIPSVEGHGERSLVIIDGELTHAVRKSPRFHGADESVSEAVPISDDEHQLAWMTIEATRSLIGVGDLLYTRVDIANDDAGQPMVMELELIEPSLFLLQHPPAADRLVTGITTRVSAAQTAP